MAKDIRWIQRFSNLKKAVEQLKEDVSMTSYSRIEKQGMIKAFEYCYELAWKTLQDFLEAKGYPEIKGPKPVIQQAFKDAYIINGDAWMKMLDSRNLTTHTYDEATANAIASLIKKDFFPLLNDLVLKLKEEEKNFSS